MLRRLMVGSAHYYILGPFGSDSDLRRHGEKIASRGGKNAKKRAAVAVARKLSVLLHRLWVTGELYYPLYNTHRRQEEEEEEEEEEQEERQLKNRGGRWSRRAQRR
jgi:transposase